MRSCALCCVPDTAAPYRVEASYPFSSQGAIVLPPILNPTYGLIYCTRFVGFEIVSEGQVPRSANGVHMYNPYGILIPFSPIGLCTSNRESYQMGDRAIDEESDGIPMETIHRT